MWPSFRFALSCPTENMAFISFHSQPAYWKYGIHFVSLSADLLKIWPFRFSLGCPAENMAFISFHCRLSCWKYGLHIISLSPVLLKIWPSFRLSALWNESAYKIMKFLSQMFLINCLLWLHLFLVFCWYITVENLLVTVHCEEILWLRSGMVSKHFAAQSDAHTQSLLRSMVIYYITHKI
jgi:hypothetical protein